MGWDISDEIAPDEGVRDEVARYYSLQLIAETKYIHPEGVFYHDLKAGNLLFGALRLSPVRCIPPETVGQAANSPH